MNITTVCAVALVLLLTGLSLNVSRLRLKYRVSYGVATHKDLEVAVRAHGNTLEQSMVFLLLLLLSETQSIAPALSFHAAWLFVLMRLVHTFATYTRQLRVRQISHVGSMALQISLCVPLLWSALR